MVSYMGQVYSHVPDQRDFNPWVSQSNWDFSEQSIYPHCCSLVFKSYLTLCVRVCMCVCVCVRERERERPRERERETERERERDQERDPADCSCQAPLHFRFPRQEYQNRLSFPSPGNLVHPGIETQCFLLGRRILYHWTTWGSPIYPHSEWLMSSCPRSIQL